MDHSTLLMPFLSRLQRDGSLSPAAPPVLRRLSDMRGHYAHVPPEMGDPEIYRVYALEVPERASELPCSTTVLQPGTVGEEFFMTKGHFHRQRDRSEVYLGLAGRGLLVLATEEGDHRVQPIEPETVNYVPGGWGHRAVNVGEEPLVFFATYVGDAGHDYQTVERFGFPVRILRGPQGPRIVHTPPRER